MIYFDAAYIAKCYLNEPGADRVRQVAYGAAGLHRRPWTYGAPTGALTRPG